MEIVPASHEAAPHIVFRNIVPARTNTRSNALERKPHVLQIQINDFNPIPPVMPLFQASDISKPAVLSKAKSFSAATRRSNSERNNRPAAIRPEAGSRGERPAASKSALTKLRICSRGKKVLANVVLPAPFGPAMIKHRGISSRQITAPPALRQARIAPLTQTQARTKESDSGKAARHDSGVPGFVLG